MAFQGNPQILSRAGGVAIDIRFSMNDVVDHILLQPACQHSRFNFLNNFKYMRVYAYNHANKYRHNHAKSRLIRDMFGGINSGVSAVLPTGSIHYQLNIYYITGISIASDRVSA